jgi:Zinc knuckle
VNWKTNQTAASHGNDRISFATKGNIGVERNVITCYRCGQQGHYANECCNARINQQHQNSRSGSRSNGTMTTVHKPENVRGHQNEHEELQFTFCTHLGEPNQVNTSTMHSNIPSIWILLDNQSTIDVVINAKLLRIYMQPKPG